jgi:hypothetical protein
MIMYHEETTETILVTYKIKSKWCKTGDYAVRVDKIIMSAFKLRALEKLSANEKLGFGIMLQHTF